MNFVLQCPYCQQQNAVPVAWGGRQVACPGCGGQMMVPQVGPPPEAERSPVASMLAEELKGTAEPPVKAVDQRLITALGIPKKKAKDLSAIQKPKVQFGPPKRPLSGLTRFMVDHKLVLVTAFVGWAMLLGALVSWKSWPAAIAALAGLGFSFGAWWSQQIAATDKHLQRERWAWQQQWIGVGVLGVLFAGATIWAGIAATRALGTADDGASSAAWGEVGKFAGVWVAVAVACVAIWAVSYKHGFFRVAAWVFLLGSALAAIVALLIKRGVLQLG